MKNPYLSYNPVFESLYQQANKYSSLSNSRIYEQSGEKLDAKKTQEYAILIIDTLFLRVITYGLKAPIRRISVETVPYLSTECETLKNSKTPEDLFNKLSKMWEECYSKALSDKSKDRIIEYYDEVNNGINKIKEAWGALLKESDKVNTEEILRSLKDEISKKVEAFKKTLEEAQQSANKAKTVVKK